VDAAAGPRQRHCGLEVKAQLGSVHRVSQRILELDPLERSLARGLVEQLVARTLSDQRRGAESGFSNAAKGAN
jgi:hypothetical protein